MLRSFICTAFVILLTPTYSQITVQVDVELSKPDAGGMLRAALCSGQIAYDTEKGCMAASVAANGPVVVLTFNDIAPGFYAAKVFHDVDGDGRIDTNVLGIPTEPYGFSKDAMGMFGPPSFKQAAFEVGKESKRIKVRMKG